MFFLYKPIGHAARESVKSRLLFFCNTFTICRLQSKVIGYGVTLLVTPLQAATKKMAGMAEWQKEWQNWQNGRFGCIRTIYGTHPTTMTTTTMTTMFNLFIY